MTDTADYNETLFLPKTDFPMRAGLPQKEPEILARWARQDLYERLREVSKGRDKFSARTRHLRPLLATPGGFAA